MAARAIAAEPTVVGTNVPGGVHIFRERARIQLITVEFSPENWSSRFCMSVRSSQGYRARNKIVTMPYFYKRAVGWPHFHAALPGNVELLVDSLRGSLASARNCNARVESPRRSSKAGDERIARHCPRSCRRLMQISAHYFQRFSSFP